MAPHQDGSSDDARRAARAAWLNADDADPGVLEAVQDGLLAVPVAGPSGAWAGLPHQRGSRERTSTLHRRR